MMRAGIYVGVAWVAIEFLAERLELELVDEEDDEGEDLDDDEDEEEDHVDGEEEIDEDDDEGTIGGSKPDTRPHRSRRRTAKQEVVDEDAIFIPLGWARQRPTAPYKGSDPEWHEFYKFSQDEARGQKTRRRCPASSDGG